ncbi:MAG: cardiolipin synthase [Lachnospiraceae bacterium]|nr:cardiolipin synthase [Lachnospiraceae bacterium]
MREDFSSGYQQQEEIGVVKQTLKKGIKKSKKGIFKLLFSRITVVAVLVLLQIFVIIASLVWIQNYTTYIYFGSLFLGIILIIYIMNRDENPSFKLVWIIPIIALPVFGVFLYFFVQLQPTSKIFQHLLKKNIDETKVYLQQDKYTKKKVKAADPLVAGLAHYIEHFGSFPIYDNTCVKYFPLGEDKFEELKIQLKRAKKFIFLEYFIVERGDMWGEVLTILLEKVREGVEVYFMYDGMCSLSALPWNYAKKMNALGIHCKMFAPIKVALSTYQNNRDHRKICVIDGHTAFTGGINLADEYINQVDRFGHWKDTAVMLQGKAVRSFTMMFLQMWNIKEKKPLSYEKYLNLTVEEAIKAPGFVMPYSDSPLDDELVGESVYMEMLYQAVDYIHFMTPYLILDNEMITALKSAAKRGVDVVLILPHIPDKKYAFYLAKTHYPALIKAGVKIYEYTPGFVHAKVCVCDDKSAVVGTINLDYRSLYLHFECAAYLYGMPEILKIEQDVQNTMLLSRRVTMEDWNHLPWHVKFFGSVLKFFAPLM